MTHQLKRNEIERCSPALRVGIYKWKLRYYRAAFALADKYMTPGMREDVIDELREGRDRAAKDLEAENGGRWTGNSGVSSSEEEEET